MALPVVTSERLTLERFTLDDASFIVELLTDPDWLRFRLVGATNPTYFALAARRRTREFEADRFSLDLLRRAGYPTG